MKKILSSLLLSAFLGLSAFAQIPTTGLVGYWPFNGNANDESGNGNNGTVNGATLTTDRFDHTNSAYLFPGSVTNKITIPHNSSFNFTQSMTISLWIEFEQSWTYHDESIIYKSSMPFNSGWQIANNQDNGNGNGNYDIHTDFFTVSTSNSSILNTHPNQILNFTSINMWNHYLFVYNGTTANIYLNGISIDTISVNGDISNNTNDITIGGALNPVSGANNRKIDDIRIFNKPLNQSEITALYNEGICNATRNVTDTLFISANITGFNPITYQNNIKIYPNPTLDKITIDCGSNYSTLNNNTIKITNSLSQTVYTSLVNKQTTTIDLNSWTGKGIYFIQLIDGSSNVIENKKIVLQ